MAFKRNKVKVDLRSYPPYLIMGDKKIGKSSLVYEIAKREFGLDKMLLISLGDEKGFHSLDGIQYEECKVWSKVENSNGERGFIQLVNDIVENNNEYGLQMVVIDTLDTLIDIGIDEVLNQHKAETGTACKSLNDAFGGFQRGRDRLVDMLKKQIDILDRMGLAVFIIAHTKNKAKVDQLTGQEYEILTNNLRSDFYSPIANSCQMIVNIAIERDFEKKREKVAVVEGKKAKKDIMIQTEEMRYMYFRGNGLVDAGSRFTDVPEKMVLSAENFMKAFEMGVKGAINNEEIDIEKQREEELKQIEEMNKKIKKENYEENQINEEQEKENLTNEIKIAVKDKEKLKKVREFLEANSIKLSDASLKQLQEIITLIK